MEDLFQDNINYKKIVHRLLSHKKLYYIAIIVLLIAAFLVNKFSEPKYANSTIISVNNNNNKQNALLSSQNDLMQGIGLFNGTENIENELEKIKSFTVINEVVKNLDLKVTYNSFKNSNLSNMLYNTPLVKKHELYDDSPIKVIVDASQAQAIDMKFRIVFINDDEFLLETSGDNVPLYNYIDDQVVSVVNSIYFKKRFHFGDEIKTRYFNFRIIKTDRFDKEYTQSNNLFFVLENTNTLTLNYIASTSVENTSKLSTLIKVSVVGHNRRKITDFLNTLISVYFEQNMEKKNSAALSTVSFIDSQISEIADSLGRAETKLKNFRTTNQVMDLSFQGQQVFTQMNKLEDEKATIETQKRYYSYLKNYINKNNDVTNLVAPSSLQVVDPILTNLINNLINLNNEKASLIKNNKTNQQNLYLEDINLKIANLLKTLRENVNNSLDNLDVSINEIDYRIKKLNNQISQMPKTELQLKGIERKFTLNDAIYTFLLQKRSEAQIARASSKPDYDIIDPARLIATHTVSPKTKLNYILAIFLGLFFPTIYIMGKDFFNNKLSEIDEIEAITNIPVLGRIFHSIRKSHLVVARYPESSVTESFRAVRTNFQFFNESVNKQVILVTSSFSGEGKTFCSINLASAMAINGHRTVLIEFDLRRPKIHQEFGASNMVGITSYLIDKAILEDIIIPTEVENLDLISAGPAAPNPAELIAMDKTSEFIEKLKEMYDYIIIDSAPVGVISETYILMKYSGLSVFIVRMNKSVKEAVKSSLNSLKNNNINNVSLLINDVDVKRDAYKYGYDSKYYHQEKRSLLKRIFGKKAS